MGVWGDRRDVGGRRQGLRPAEATGQAYVPLVEADAAEERRWAVEAERRADQGRPVDERVGVVGDLAGMEMEAATA